MPFFIVGEQEDRTGPLRFRSLMIEGPEVPTLEEAEALARTLRPDDKYRILEAPPLGRALLQLMPDSVPEDVRREMERVDWPPPFEDPR